MQITTSEHWKGIEFDSLREAFNGLALLTWQRTSGIQVEYSPNTPNEEKTVTSEWLMKDEERNLRGIWRELSLKGVFSERFPESDYRYLSDLQLTLIPSEQGGALLEMAPRRTNKVEYEEDLVGILNFLHINGKLAHCIPTGRINPLFKDRKYSRILHNANIKVALKGEESSPLEKAISHALGENFSIQQYGEDGKGERYYRRQYAGAKIKKPLTTTELSRTSPVAIVVSVYDSNYDSHRREEIERYRWQLEENNIAREFVEGNTPDHLNDILAGVKKGVNPTERQTKAFVHAIYRIDYRTGFDMQGKPKNRILHQIDYDTRHINRSIEATNLRPNYVAEISFSHPESKSGGFYSDQNFLLYARDIFLRSVQEKLDLKLHLEPLQ